MSAPRFTKHHFVAVARILRQELDGAGSLFRRSIVVDVAERFAERFAADNPRFDIAKFLGACGLTLGDLTKEHRP